MEVKIAVNCFNTYALKYCKLPTRVICNNENPTSD